MKNKKDKSSLPPKLADLLLELFHSDEQLEEIQGDLYELYYERVEELGKKKANQMYWTDALKFIKPFNKSRKSEGFSAPVSFDMLSLYLKETFRDFKKNKAFSYINLVGLSIGFAAFLIITQYVLFEKSYDTFHEKGDRIYRVPFSWEPLSKGNSWELYASNVPAFGPAAKKDLPEVKSYARLFDVQIKSPVCVLSYKDKNYNIVAFNEDKGFYADPDFLSMFSFPLIHGKKSNALSAPYSILLSESLAQKFFNGRNPVGEVLQVKFGWIEEYRITGVFKDVPPNSHIKFDFLLSYSSLGNGAHANSWYWSLFYTYLELKEGADIAKTNARLNDLLKKYDRKDTRLEVFLQPIKDIHLTSTLRYEADRNGSERTVNFLSIISIVIILIAVINYINLSTVKALERAKEVGIKKAIGADRYQLFIQFLFQTFVYNVVASLFSLIIIAICIPLYLQGLTDGVIGFALFIDPDFWIYLGAIILFSTLFAGIYPSLIIASYRSVEVIKGQLKTSPKGLFFRKAMVMTQFVASIVLAICTIIIFKQFDFMVNKDLGIDMAQTIVLKSPSVSFEESAHKIEVLKNQLKKNPVVKEVTVSSNIPGKNINTTMGMIRTNGEPRGNTNFFYVGVDEDFTKVYELEFLAGRNFTKGFNEKHSVIINESSLKQLKIKDAESALNEKLLISREPPELNIIGVIKDFHNKSLDSPIESIVLYEDSVMKGFISVKVASSKDIGKTIDFIKEQFKDVYKDAPFDYFFMDEFFNQQYQQERRNVQVFTSFSSIAIFIACLGLIGLTIYSTIKRAKEIAVRKILGASVLNVLFLLLKEVIYMIAFAILVAIPIAYLFSNSWLQNYAYKIDPSPIHFFLPGMAIGGMAILIVLLLVLKNVRVLPVKYLKEE